MGIVQCRHHWDKNKLIKKVVIGVAATIFILGLIALIVCLVLRPKKPDFILLDATVYTFNLTGPAELTSTFQVTVQAKNPNDNLGVYYDRLISFATYQDQQITLSTGIPPTYQDSNGINIWSPFLSGVSIPIAPFIGAEINQDRSIGSIHLIIKLDGWIRWKVRTITSRTYRIHVSCPVTNPFGINA